MSDSMNSQDQQKASRKHHYVPQFLLKNFTDAKGRVNVFDKKMRVKRRQSAREIAHENDLYVYRNEDGTTKNLEGMTAKLDEWGSAAIKMLIATEAISSLDGEHRAKLAYFIAAMLIRTPHTRKRMLAFNRHIVEKWGPDVCAVGSDDRAGDYSEERARNATIEMIAKDTPEFARHLQNKIWLLVKSPDPNPFYLSDNPVTRHNLIERPGRGNLGLRSVGIEIYMPISPHLCLTLLCPEMANLARLTPETGVSEAYYTDTPISYKEDNVTHLNHLQVINSERFLFSAVAEFSLAEEMVTTHPELSNGTGLQFFRE